jgi:predicted nucleotidyltransferase component of viral defense system
MLERAHVMAGYPSEARTLKRNVLREYLQMKMLQYLFSSADAASLVFMGGTAIRLIHGSDRFSEDLDFDNRSLSTGFLEQLAVRVQRQFAREGVACDLRTHVSSKLAWTVRFRFTTILQQWGLTRHREEVLLIKFDTEPQHYLYQPIQFVLNRLDVFSLVLAAPIDLLLAQKCVAILQRPRLMGRDLYDAAVLLGQSEPDERYLREKLGIQTREELGKLLLARCETANLSRLADDLIPFLPNRDSAGRVVHFPEIVQRSLARI